MSAAIQQQNQPDRSARELWHAAGMGDLERLNQLLDQGLDVNIGDRTGVTALMRAAYHGQLPIVQALIERGADLNAKDNGGLTALMMAKHAGHQDTVDSLLAAGAQGKPETKRRLVGSVSDETVSAAVEIEPPKTKKSTEVRTLHEPPEIWDMVRTNGPVEDRQPEPEPRKNVAASVLESAADIESPQIRKSTEVRTLHEPSEIWDMVRTNGPSEDRQPETEPANNFASRIFDAGEVHTTQPRDEAAFVRYRSGGFQKALALGFISLVVCGAAAFGALFLRGAFGEFGTSKEEPATTTAQSNPPFTLPQPPAAAKERIQPQATSSRLSETPAVLPSVKVNNERADRPRAASATSVALPLKKPAAKRGNTANKSGAPFFPEENDDRPKTTRVNNDSGVVKKKEPAQTPAVQASDSPKATSQPKPKVIQWP